MDIERRDKTVHPDGSEEVEVTPYNKVFIGEVRAAALLMSVTCRWLRALAGFEQQAK